VNNKDEKLNNNVNKFNKKREREGEDEVRGTMKGRSRSERKSIKRERESNNKKEKGGRRKSKRRGRERH
jgi:hypothetical protein